MEMDIIQVISQVGFPIGVATFSLLVLNKTIEKNTETMNRIDTKLDVITTMNRIEEKLDSTL